MNFIKLLESIKFKIERSSNIKEIKRKLVISGILSAFIVSAFLVSALTDMHSKSFENINESINIKVCDENKISNLNLSGEDLKNNRTVLDAIKLSDIEFKNYYICNHRLDEHLHDNMNILIKKTVEFRVQDSDKYNICIMPNNINVSQALELLEIELSEHDIINCELTDNISDHNNIVINRVTFDELTYCEPVKYTTVTRKEYTLNYGSEKIISEGASGEREVSVKRKLIDGEVVSTEELSSKILTPAKERIVLIGAKRDINRKSEPKITSPDQQVKKILTGKATAYSKSGCVLRPGGKIITSTGTVPVEGVTAAVDPSQIPYGSKIRVRTIDGYYDKVLTAQDTGAAMRSGRAMIDIYMDSEQDCRNFGVRTVEVSVLG